MNDILGFTNVYDYIWLIPLAFSIHEIEEWNILKWYKRHYKNLPPSTNTSIRIHIIVLSAVSIVLTLLAYVTRETFIFSLIVVFLSSFMLQNFLQHVIWTVQLKAYSTGLATSVLSVLFVAYINVLLIQNHLILLPFYAMVLLIIPPLWRTMKVKGEMTKDVLTVHRFFIKVEKVLRGMV